MDAENSSDVLMAAAEELESCAAEKFARTELLGLRLGALFGILGLALADPMIAMIKIALERQSERLEDQAEGSG